MPNMKTDEFYRELIEEARREKALEKKPVIFSGWELILIHIGFWFLFWTGTMVYTKGLEAVVVMLDNIPAAIVFFMLGAAPLGLATGVIHILGRMFR